MLGGPRAARLTFHSAGRAHGASELGTGAGINQRLYDVGECGPGGLRTARCNTYLSGRQFLLVHLFLALDRGLWSRSPIVSITGSPGLPRGQPHRHRAHSVCWAPLWARGFASDDPGGPRWGLMCSRECVMDE